MDSAILLLTLFFVHRYLISSNYYSLPNILTIWSVSTLLSTMNILHCAHTSFRITPFCQVLSGHKFQVLNVLQRVTACEIAQVAEMTNNLLSRGSVVHLADCTYHLCWFNHLPYLFDHKRLFQALHFENGVYFSLVSTLHT